jgi:hypothetical protein
MRATAHIRPSAVVVVAMVSAAMVSAMGMPAVPSGTAAPTETAAVRVAAPVEAGTAPAVRVEAVSPTTENELCLLDVGWSLDAGISGQRICGRKRAESGDRRRNGYCINPIAAHLSTSFAN